MASYDETDLTEEENDENLIKFYYALWTIALANLTDDEIIEQINYKKQEIERMNARKATFRDRVKRFLGIRSPSQEFLREINEQDIKFLEQFLEKRRGTSNERNN